MSAPRLCLNHDADYDWLIAVELGRNDEGQAAEAWDGVSDRFGVLHDGDGRAIGFKMHRFSTFDAEAPEVAAIWEPPLYDAPVLGLRAASAGEIILAARAHFGGTSSVGRGYFDAAAALMRDAVTGCGALVKPGPSFLEASLVRPSANPPRGRPRSLPPVRWRCQSPAGTLSPARPTSS